jgi:Transposase DDE domain group 1
MTYSSSPFEVPLLPHKPVAIDFDGGDLSSDAGFLPLSLADRATQLTRRLADAVADPRDPQRIEHSLQELFQERIYLIAQGYEDAVDANTLRADPLLKLAVGRDPEAAPLAGQSTLSRFENAITPADLQRLGQVLIEAFLDRCGPAPEQIVLDLDPFVDECHGAQQLVLFNGHYDCHCYLPLYVCGTIDGGRPFVIGALLRGGRAAPTRGVKAVLHHLVPAIRARYPEVTIIVRADGAFGVPKVINTCRHLQVHFCLGKPQNAALNRLSERLQLRAAVEYTVTKRCERHFAEFEYAAASWERAERTVAKVEVTQGKLNPRFVVTDLAGPDGFAPAQVYCFYCQRGDAPENRIKEFKVDLAADRLSCQQFLANQFRLVLHVAAYMLIQTMQEHLAGTALAAAQAGTIRVKLLKVAARVLGRCRVVRVQLPRCYPWQSLWRRLVGCLQAAASGSPVAAPAGL